HVAPRPVPACHHGPLPLLAYPRSLPDALPLSTPSNGTASRTISKATLLGNGFTAAGTFTLQAEYLDRSSLAFAPSSSNDASLTLSTKIDQTITFTTIQPAYGGVNLQATAS